MPLEWAAMGSKRIPHVRRRSSVAPDIPTLAEQGAPGDVVTFWYGSLAPTGTSPELVEQLVRDTTVKYL